MRTVKPKPGMKFYCFNCGAQFPTRDEARVHWLKTTEAPINDIIREIKPNKPIRAGGKSHGPKGEA